jgi:outer membrane protein assembly factor BamB
MATAQMIQPAVQKPPRLWPGVLAVVLQWLAWLVLPVVAPEAAYYAVMGGVLGGGLAVLLWWLLFSRVPWPERVGAVVLMPVAVLATLQVVHESIATGAMGMLLPLYAIPVLCLALVCWAVVSRRLGSTARSVSLDAVILLACGVFALLRTGGMSGDGKGDFHWRWTPTPEQRLLDSGSDEPATPPSARTTTGQSSPAAAKSSAPTAMSVSAAAKTAASWPGFRGPGRDGIVRGVRIATDWSGSSPVELWHRAVGPGWSSFAVDGDLFYTQEQRGGDEVVACHRVSTGRPVWRHRDRARFWESNAGAGPRATPTLSDGRVYTLGATGIVNALDAATGAFVWSRNAADDTGRKVPHWGFAGSPLVVGDAVVVATADRLVAYDRATGTVRWRGPVGDKPAGGYSSPQLATIGGVQQVLLLNGAGVIGVAPATGTQLWSYAWPGDGIVQPALTADGDVLLGSGSGLNDATGVRRIAVAHGPNGWTAQERWTSEGLKPYFNDFVVHAGHAYGFDGGFLACIDLADGARKWKGGRYDHGQVILLADQDLLLVLSEKGGVALVAATPEHFRELARRPAIEGKTWNHPVLAGDVLLARNGEEMVALRLPPAGR